VSEELRPPLCHSHESGNPGAKDKIGGWITVFVGMTKNIFIFLGVQ